MKITHTSREMCALAKSLIQNANKMQHAEPSYTQNMQEERKLRKAWPKRIHPPNISKRKAAKHIRGEGNKHKN